jgi:hypothetical protein
MDIRKIISDLQPAKGIRIADGMQNSIDEKNSLWRYQISFSNQLSDDYWLIIFTGKNPHNRIAKVTKDGNNYYFSPLYGDPVPIQTSGCSGWDESFIIRSDFNNEFFELFSYGKYIVPSNKRICVYPQETQIAQGDTYLRVSSGRNYDFSIDAFRDFLHSNPLRLFEIQINTDNTLQFGKNIKFGYKEPFKKFQTIDIAISEYYDVQANRKKVVIPKTLYLDASAIMAIEIPAKTNTDMTFLFSHDFCPREYLKAKTNYENYLKILNQK